jgi:transcriptional regulator with XRE-family HTH domain
VNTGSDARSKLVGSLRDKQYRHQFASAVIRRGLAEQIREMRLRRGWTQADLANASGKVQETISQLENPNYGSYTIKTLQRLAEAFDVALIVRFAPFSELASWVTNMSAEDLAVPGFEHDPGLAPSGVHGELTLTAQAMPPMKIDMTPLGRQFRSSLPKHTYRPAFTPRDPTPVSEITVAKPNAAPELPQYTLAAA